MTNRLIVLIHLFLIVLVQPSMSQSDLILKNAKPIDQARYDRIKGSPYIREEWFTADIIPTAGDFIRNVRVNYNGYTRLFEVRQGDQFIELEQVDFVGIRVEANAACGDNTGFYKYRHPKLHHPYPFFAYNGHRWKLIKDFRASLVEKKIETPGKTEVFKSFNDVAAYYLLHDDVLELVRLNKKDILEKLNFSGAEAYVKENKLDLGSEEDVCRLLSWMEAQ